MALVSPDTVDIGRALPAMMPLIMICRTGALILYYLLFFFCLPASLRTIFLQPPHTILTLLPKKKNASASAP
jgi:hypothetical protein